VPVKQATACATGNHRYGIKKSATQWLIKCGNDSKLLERAKPHPHNSIIFPVSLMLVSSQGSNRLWSELIEDGRGLKRWETIAS